MIKLKKIIENILLDWSKNDAIPEIAQIKDHLCLFLFGPPASGKSTFVKDFILRLNRNFSMVNPDDIAYLLQKKDYGNERPPGISRLSMSKAKSILQSGNNMIYDTTGNDFDRISLLTKEAKDNNYTTVFIHVLDSLDDILSKAGRRERPTDIEYIKSSYSRTQKLIKRFYKELDPDSYYIVTTLGNKYKFYKYEDDKLLKRKVDKYEWLN